MALEVVLTGVYVVLVRVRVRLGSRPGLWCLWVGFSLVPSLGPSGDDIDAKTVSAPQVTGDEN